MARNTLSATAIVLLTIVSCGCREYPAGPGHPVTLRVGHVAHDHHLALYVALDNAEAYAARTGISVRKDRDREFYELFDGGRHVANLHIIQVGGGARMPTALAQGIIDVGLGGTAPVLAACDRGAPVKLIAPLHSKGNMLVVRPDTPVESWQDFVTLVRNSETPFRMGYKSPMAVAKLLLEDALRYEGVAFGGGPADAGVRVNMINVKEDGNLNVSLSQGLIDGYVGNNPFPAIGVEKGFAKIVCALDDLPPGRFRDHPCCCIAANMRSLAGKEDAVVGLLVLLLQANETINDDLDAVVPIACRWIGAGEKVERMSIPTSGYSLEPDAAWHEGMGMWFEVMNDLGIFQGGLLGLDRTKAAALACELSLLERAEKRLAAGGAHD